MARTKAGGLHSDVIVMYNGRGCSMARTKAGGLHSDVIVMYNGRVTKYSEDKS